MFLPPSIILIIGGLIIATNRINIVRNAAIILFPLMALYEVLYVGSGAGELSVVLSTYTLELFNISPYSKIFATVFCLAALGGGIFGMKHSSRVELSSAYMYAGCALGVVYAGNMITLFIFWELMLVTSLIVLWSAGTESSRKAGMRYGILHLIGGMLLLIGIFAGGFDLHQITTPISELPNLFSLNKAELADWLILAGFMINAAGPMVSAWVPDAYPESTPFGGIFLSAFTTKTTVFVLITMAAGNEILIYLGLFMVFYGIIYAMLENDIRRILSYSIVNQVGFMVVAVGIGTEMALMGAATHAFCHIIYKGLLFMSAGSVLYMTGKRKCTEVGGLYRTMPFTTFCGIVGALAISAFPYTSGFVSKSLTAAAAADQHLTVVWFMLLAASAGVFLHAGVKFPWFVFFNRDSGLRPKDPPWNMRLAMLFFVALCFLPGLFPEYLYALLPQEEVAYKPYTAEHVVTQLQLLLFAGLAFFMALPLLKRTETLSLDADWIWRVFLRKIFLLAEKLIVCVYSGISVCFSKHYAIIHNDIKKHYSLKDGVLAENWSIGTTLLLMAGLLGLYLAYYYMTG